MTDAEKMRERRLLHPVPATLAGHLFAIPAMDWGVKKRMLLWISLNTVGEFYFGHNVLYFLNSKDAMAYTLFNVREKCDHFDAS